MATIVDPSASAIPKSGDPQPLVPIPETQSVEPVKIEAASFNGVIPGQSTAADVEKAWGAPKEVISDGGARIQLHAVGPFQRVEVTYVNGKVASIVIRLDQSFPANAVAQQLELTPIRPVLVSNELGEILGQAYPERGVLFAFEPSSDIGKASMKVAQIVLEPVTAEPFVLRAETDLETRYDLSLSDLQEALKIEPDNARANWLHGRVLEAVGKVDEAVAAATHAVRLAPGNPQYRVTRARILSQTGQLKEAALEARRAVEIGQSRPHVKARALCLLGDLVASGPTPNYNIALSQHTQAIEEANPLATSRHPAIRIAAKEVLVDAHLGVAHDIAWGNWNQKERAGIWLDRAEMLAEELVENDGGTSELRFRVGSRALAACLGLRGALDPAKWAKTVLNSGEVLISGAQDAHRKAQYQWDLGMALYDAMQIYQMRSDHDMALKYGEWAIEYLEKGDQRKLSASSDYLFGRLYFRLGAIHAIRDENHRAAITWFEKAVPLLKKPLPENVFVHLGRHGETFVSMGVSYWESGQRDKAVELTQFGIEMMEQAVRQGTLDESSMTIPYSNLSSMHRQLGSHDRADHFDAMAKRNAAGASLR